jgi:hypothetical protein
MAANAQQAQQHHYTPPWLDWIATNVVPSAMIVAEFIIGSLFYVVTSVRNPYVPQSWSALEWGLAVVAGAVGIAMAGLALKLSGMAAEMLATGHVIRGFATFLGVLALAIIETWAGIVERASLVGVGKADLLLADYTGIDAFRHIPTSVFMVSFLLPCLVLWYGWASRPPVVISAEEQAATHQKKLADARFKAEMRAIQAGGLGAALRSAQAGITGKKDDALPASNDEGNSPVHDGDTPENVTPFKPSRVPGKKTARQWTSSDLQAYIRATYGRELDDITAGNTIRSLGSNRRLDGIVGQPYYANNLTAKGWADKLYSSGSGDAIPTGTGER